MATPAQVLANRRNARSSTGPRTAAGRARVAWNSFSHGLRSRAVVLPDEDPAAFRRLYATFCDEYCPVDSGREDWVFALAVSVWKIRRAARIDAAICDAPEPAAGGCLQTACRLAVLYRCLTPWERLAATAISRLNRLRPRHRPVAPPDWLCSAKQCWAPGSSSVHVENPILEATSLQKPRRARGQRLKPPPFDVTVPETRRRNSLRQMRDNNPMRLKLLGGALACAWVACSAQVPAGGGAQSGAPAPTPAIDLQEALRRARDYSQQFQSAVVAASLAREDRVQARAAQLPALNYFNQYIYTQGNGTPSGVFVANDGVHIYNSQATVHADLFSLTKMADYRRTVAAQAMAEARRDIALRGLMLTVVQNYYGMVLAERHAANAARGVGEARQFLDITQKQERGGEVAHADVLKAELQFQQRQRDLADAEVATERAKVALGVMLFPDPAQDFRVMDDLQNPAPLLSLDEFRAQAFAGNPDIRAAEAGAQEAQQVVSLARSAYFPSLGLDYFFGIDANQFAIYGPDDRHNLGSVVQATLNIPVWNWWSTRSKVRQAEMQRSQARFDLTYTQRQLQASLRSFYLEAQAARAQLDSLRDSLDLATQSLRLTLLRYQGGEATALEVADAQTTLVQARNAHDDGLARYRLALANLQNLTGRY